MRRLLSVDKDTTLIGIMAPAESDYPMQNGIGHNDFMLNLLQQVLRNSKGKAGILYRPHSRGEDCKPEQFANLPNNIQIIYHPREWWIKRGINLHMQLMACDIAQSTNSTMQVEVFTAWANGITPMAVPIDVILTNNFAHLPVNQTLLKHKLSTIITSVDQFLTLYPDIITHPERYKPVDASKRLKAFGWEENPLDKITAELLNLI